MTSQSRAQDGLALRKCGTQASLPDKLARGGASPYSAYMHTLCFGVNSRGRTAPARSLCLVYDVRDN